MSTAQTHEIDKSTLPPEALVAFEQGHTITVTEGGKPVGQILPDPVERAKAELKALRKAHPVDSLAELIKAAEPR